MSRVHVCRCLRDMWHMPVYHNICRNNKHRPVSVYGHLGVFVIAMHFILRSCDMIRMQSLHTALLYQIRCKALSLALLLTQTCRFFVCVGIHACLTDAHLRMLFLVSVIWCMYGVWCTWLVRLQYIGCLQGVWSWQNFHQCCRRWRKI